MATLPQPQSQQLAKEAAALPGLALFLQLPKSTQMRGISVLQWREMQQQKQKQQEQQQWHKWHQLLLCAFQEHERVGGACPLPTATPEGSMFSPAYTSKTPGKSLGWCWWGGVRLAGQGRLGLGGSCTNRTCRPLAPNSRGRCMVWAVG